MYSVAIVGLGHVAEHQIAALQYCENVKLAAGCDPNSTRFSILDSSVATYTDIDRLLETEVLDVVIIASPNRLHVDHGIKVMEAGKWLLMEKPLAESASEFSRFENARRALDGKCSIALHAAHGKEVEWFRKHESSPLHGIGPLVGFDARFYDPYFHNGVVLQHALSLGGSWIDSGINALSVIARLIEPELLEILDSRMTRVAGAQCTEVQGTVDFRWGSDDPLGYGAIDTNWTLGRNSKITQLRFAADDSIYRLDHSNQRVIQVLGSQSRELYSNPNGLPRLTNHYIGVFRDLVAQLERGEDNFSGGAALHRHLYRASVLDSSGAP